MSTPPPPGGPYPPPQHGVPGGPPPVYPSFPPGAQAPPPYLPPPGLPGGPPRQKGNPAAFLVVLLMGVLVLGGCGVGGFILLSDDDDDGRDRTISGSRPLFPTSVPTPTFSAPSFRPSTPSVPRKPVVGLSFFARSVSTSSGTYLQSSSWDKSCTSGVKPRLATLNRQENCKGRLYGAMYQGPNKRTYVQMTLIQFPDSASARSVSRRINSSTAPTIRVAYGNEPGHWWSSSSVGEYVLIRQSFNNASRYAGPRSGPAQVLGDVLIRRFQTELTNVYTWSN
ncbi:hypothetical protein [Actinomadura rudentiformis]|uniref:Uncharacterized protein n=1 Tax=Actinomadura rudentiformis TaxID=359158 RepID=A0A6H9YKU2_9ACTN|nr:hypothetical protein [Actinomadura rudentiformis]KAB2347848.1 hypothetical protein F8566_18315 [Actinomadura rudentiformis]